MRHKLKSLWHSVPWSFQDSQSICEYYRQFKHFLQADKGLHLPDYSWVADICSKLRSKSVTSLALDTFQGSCFVFTNPIYQIPPRQSLAEFQLRWLCWHFSTGNLQDAVLSRLHQFSSVSSLDSVLLSVPVPLFLDFLILCFQPAACPPVL